MCLVVLRAIRTALARDGVVRVVATVNRGVQDEIQNRMRKRLLALEEKSDVRIIIVGDGSLGVEDIKLECLNAKGDKMKAKK